MKKISLYQVGKTTLQCCFSVYSAGIYQKLLSLSEASRLASPITTIFGATWDDSLSAEPVEVEGASYENVTLSEVSQFSDLYLTDGSFCFDFATQIIYIAIFDYKNFTHSDTINVGNTIGFLSEAQNELINGYQYPLNAFVGSVHYDPRLTDISISNQLNDQKNSLFVYSGFDASIKNDDGEYDDIKDSISGNTGTLLVATISDSKSEEIETGFPYKIAADPEDFVIKRTGIVEDIDYSDPDMPVIRHIEERSNWSQKISPNFLTTADYPNLPDKYAKTRKPMLIGPANGIKCIPLRDNSTAASFDYLICDTSIGAIQSISAIYFKGQIDDGGGKEDIDRYLTLTTEYTVNLTTGIVTILNCIKGDVYAYGTCTTMNETVEIILYLLNAYANTPYIDNNFNKLEMEAIRDLDFTTHVYIDGKGKKLSDVIQKLCTDCLIDMYPQGKVMTMRQSNVERVALEEIPNYQIVQNPPGWSNDRADTIKTITVQYNQDYREKLFETYYDDSREETALDNNIKAEDAEFTVNLTNVTDIETIYDNYYSRFVIEPRTVTLNRTFPFTAGLGDFVIFPVVRQSKGVDKEIYSHGVYKIIEINESDDYIKAVYFSNARTVLYTVEWDENPAYVYQWSDDSTTIILEAP